jgi:hypothetical protein
MNLVPGGARRGLFQTRGSKNARLLEPFEFSETRSGGQVVTRTCWKGLLYMADGKTVDTTGVWEVNGAKQNPNGVIQRDDLVEIIREEPLEATAALTSRA